MSDNKIMGGKAKIFVAQPIFLMEKQNYSSHDQILSRKSKKKILPDKFFSDRAKYLENDQFLAEKAKFWSHDENFAE